MEMINQYSQQNFITFPIKPNTKKPKNEGWTKLKKPAKIRVGENTGILTGEASGITVLDIDIKDQGMYYYQTFLDKFNGGEPIDTPTTKTPSGGKHLIFKYWEAPSSAAKMIKVKVGDAISKIGFDIRNNGGCIVAPPSKIDDVEYQWENDYSLEDIEIAEIPEFLKKLLTNHYFDVETSELVEIVVRAPIKPLKFYEPCKNGENNSIRGSLSEQAFVEILSALDPKRADAYDDWFKVGAACRHIQENYGINTIEHYIKWSEQSANFKSREDVIQQFNGATNSITMGSVWYWLRADNTEKFNELYSKWRKLNPPKYYFEDYYVLNDEIKKNKYIDYMKVVEYLQSAIIKVENSGNTLWFSRNKPTDSSNDDFALLDSMPFQNPKTDIRFKYKILRRNEEVEGKKEEVIEKISSFGMVLNKISKLSSYQNKYLTMNYHPYLFECDKAPIDLFNRFKGFPFKYENQYDESNALTHIQMILDHQKNILCDGNESVYEYYINYQAHAIQKPFEKPETALIFISDEGYGKDLINYDFLRLVYGTHQTKRLKNLNCLTKQFNKHLESSLWTVGGELKDRKGVSDIDEVKALITNKTLLVEPKGKEAYEVSDYQRLVFNTNNKIPIPISEHERRFIISKINKPVPERDYINKLVNVVFNPETQRNYFQYLAHRDISGWNSRVIPNTAEKDYIKQFSLSNVIRFLIEFIKSKGRDAICSVKDDIIKIHSSTLYSSYVDWCANTGERTKSSMKSFKAMLRGYNINEHEAQFKLNGTKRSGYILCIDSICEKLKIPKGSKTFTPLDDDEDEKDDEINELCQM